MKPYLISLAVGLAVSLIYSFLGVRSPAPPAVALIGLPGEQAGNAATRWMRGAETSSAAPAASIGKEIP